jgi:hypothetical protein
MTSLRRALFLALVFVPAGSILSSACSSGGPLPPPPTTTVPPIDSGLVVRDTGQLDTGTMDTADSAQPDTNPADTFEAGVDACEAGPSPDGGGVISVSPSALFFVNTGAQACTMPECALVSCGSVAAPQTITITNPTCEPINWMSSANGMGDFVLSPASGMMLAPGATQQVTVVPAEVPITSAITPDLYQGVITIATTAPGDVGHIIQAHETAYGVILTSTSTGIAFNNVVGGESAQQQYNLSNGGNAPASVILSVGSTQFSVSPSPLNLSESMPSGVVTVTFAPPVTMTSTPYMDEITTSLPNGTPTCAPLPAHISLTGTATPVPTGVTIAPTTVNFNRVNCGGPAAPLQTITILTSNVPANSTYTASFMTGTSFTLASYEADAALTPGSPILTGTPLPLPQMGSLVLDIVPNPIPFPATTANDGYGDTLTITTNVPADPMHVITIEETAQGAILAFSPTMLTLSGTPGLMTTQNLQVTNAGNLAASFTLSLGAETPMPMNAVFSLNGADGGTLTEPSAPGSPANVLLTLDPPPLDTMMTGQACGGEAGTACSTGTCNAMMGQCQVTSSFQTTGNLTLTPAPGAVLCATVPQPVPLALTN